MKSMRGDPRLMRDSSKSSQGMPPSPVAEELEDENGTSLWGAVVRSKRNFDTSGFNEEGDPAEEYEEDLAEVLRGRSTGALDPEGPSPSARVRQDSGHSVDDTDDA